MARLSKSKWLIISIIIDAVLINCAIILSFLLRFGGRLPVFNFQAYTNLALFITLIQLGAFYVYDLYDPEKVQSGWDVFFSVLKAVTLSTLIIMSITFFFRFFSFPRTIFAISWALIILIISGWRMLALNVLKIKWPTQRILIIGTDEIALQLLRELKERSRWGYEVVGLVEKDAKRVGRKIEEIPIVGGISDIVELVRKYDISRIIITSPTHHRKLLDELAKAEETSVKVEAIPEIYEIFIGKVDYSLVNDIPLIKLTKDPVPSWVFGLKRIIDILLAVFLGILSMPIMIIASIIIKITSKGPVFYKQIRVGEEGRPFALYKFRTMVVGAEKESGPVLAVKNDSRITLVGKFLRKTRADELPQLWNILKGNMSFVGPRPERPYFVEKHKKSIPGYEERFKIKPGITGLAQVSGSYLTTPENKLKYDLIYVYHQSILLDLKILLQTVKVVLTGKGAR
ncbi:sugar transferase [Candidatus Oleimmundimicrobium sp.]|uniref:sugar transferase n=1 Tax=Candidatus Oleimmundimicrobium sp. TaxID=3060597 RepID=UPI002720D986|nr:sugar transferase [Candidatus Oleimmundimicrobium sp.]MDO8885925.1 sugar transferase [Candidatus Oleimmundimicrobium sp.]